MRRFLLSLVAVAMLAVMATPAMADHRHHPGCSHWSSHRYSTYSYYPRPYHRRVYHPPYHVRYGHYGPPVYYGAPYGIGFSNRNFSFWFGH